MAKPTRLPAAQIEVLRALRGGSKHWQNLGANGPTLSALQRRSYIERIHLRPAVWAITDAGQTALDEYEARNV